MDEIFLQETRQLIIDIEDQGKLFNKEKAYINTIYLIREYYDRNVEILEDLKK